MICTSGSVAATATAAVTNKGASATATTAAMTARVMGAVTVAVT